MKEKTYKFVSWVSLIAFCISVIPLIQGIENKEWIYFAWFGLFMFVSNLINFQLRFVREDKIKNTLKDGKKEGE